MHGPGVVARDVVEQVPGLRFAEQRRQGADDGGPHVGVAVGSPEGARQQGNCLPGRQEARGEPYGLLAGGHLRGPLPGEQCAQGEGEFGGSGETGGAGRRVHGHPGPVAARLFQERGQGVVGPVGPGQGGERGLGDDDLRVVLVRECQRLPELGHRGRGPDEGGPLVERKSKVRDSFSGQQHRRPLLAGQPAVAVAEVRQRAPGPVHQEAPVGRGRVEQGVQQIRAPSAQYPPYGREDDRRRFERDDPGDPFVAGRRSGQPQFGRHPERLVVAAFQCRDQPLLELGQPPGPWSQCGGQAQQQPEVGPSGPGVEPGAQGLEHLVLLAPPQDAVQRAEVGYADPAGDALQGAQRPVPQLRRLVRGVLDEQTYGEGAQCRHGPGGTVPCLEHAGRRSRPAGGRRRRRRAAGASRRARRAPPRVPGPARCADGGPPWSAAR